MSSQFLNHFSELKDPQIERCRKHEKEIRYFISSLSVDAPRMLATIRSHLAIENSLHWVLDMTFREDASRVRRGDAAENLSMLRRLVLNICRRNKTGKSNQSKVRRAGWNDDVRTQRCWAQAPRTHKAETPLNAATS